MLKDEVKRCRQRLSDGGIEDAAFEAVCIAEYITGFGMISLGVFTDSVKVNLDDKGGEIKVHYNIDVQSELASVNELTINIKEAVNDVGSYSDIEQS